MDPKQGWHRKIISGHIGQACDQVEYVARGRLHIHKQLQGVDPVQSILPHCWVAGMMIFSSYSLLGIFALKNM